MMRQRVTLDVPYDPTNAWEDVPANWNWTVLTDSVEPVTVVSADDPREVSS